jgi:RNase H-like domain found in reverse transcriptase
MKKILSQETFLAYPNFSKPFDVYTDASKLHLGAEICQENRPIAFYSRKLNPVQTRYTTTEQELLAMI